MKITVASINFHPDHAGIAIYATDLPVFLAERGHAVAMVSGFPYYPIWRKKLEDRGRLFSRDTYARVKVYRGYLYVPERITALRRIVHELTFCAFAAVNFLRAGRPDGIIVFTPPVLLGLVALLIKKLWRCPLIINVQDLPIEAATSLGMVKAGMLTRTLAAIERWVFLRSDFVATISDGMRATLLAKGVPAQKLGVFPNWIDVTAARLRVEAGAFIRAHPQAARAFTVAYAGNIGVKQGIRTLVELSARVRRSDIHFFIIGDGADRQALVAYARELGVRNVTFLPFLGKQEYREMLEDVDVIYVGQKAGTGDIFFPSKLLGVMAAGKPMLVSADPTSELARVVEREKVGLVSAFGDINALEQNLLRLADDAELRRTMAGNGHRHVMEYDRTRILSRLERKLQELAAGPGRDGSLRPQLDVASEPLQTVAGER